MKRMVGVIGGCLVLLAAVGFGQQTSVFLRVVSPTGSVITALSPDGTMTWTNAATAGVTCTVQRAETLAGPSNWVDYVQHEVTNAAMVLRLFDPTPPAGMALIPAGSFQMGDNLGDGWYPEVPVHTVYVSAFYMDKTEVTWAKWQEVRDWAATNGYDIGSVGTGKADSHPVHIVNWYDCVKWCNARSQKEGRTPCYTRGGVTYNTEEHDDIVCNWVATGYRLPTEAEWEKAARGGLSGKRFPWGDTIQHSRANYNSSASYAYDTSPKRGYQPDYDNSPSPYTSPCGSFAANGYGLYDMSGNLWEW
ncbi:MAG: SUMF1/EgtB/PvdO family nonheme iron enzyme, partial [bacterium]